MTAGTGEAPEFGLEHDAWGRLVLVDRSGMRHVGVEPVRGFPVSDPDQFVSICDAQGSELLSVPDVRQLRPAVRDVLEQDLARREFVPLVTRIVKISTDSEPAEWEVETDRGPTRFMVNSSDDVRRLGEHRALLIDEHGIRYMIADVRELDKSSRRILEHYL